MIIFVGLAGSGKTTQGKLLAKKIGCPWLSTGQMLRDSVQDPEISQRMLKGEVLSDDILLPLMDAELKKLHADSQEMILDGSPRSVYQAHWLADRIKQGEIMLTAIIHLKTSQETAKERLLARHRPDDHEAAIAERFSEYENTIKPIISYLESQDFKVYEVDGEQPAEVVDAGIISILGLK